MEFESKSEFAIASICKKFFEIDMLNFIEHSIRKLFERRI